MVISIPTATRRAAATELNSCGGSVGAPVRALRPTSLLWNLTTPDPTDRYGRAQLRRLRKYNSRLPRTLCSELSRASWESVCPRGEGAVALSGRSLRFHP